MMVWAQVKVAAVVVIAVMGVGAGAVVLPQVVARGATTRPVVVMSRPAGKEAAVERENLALACWGAIVSEDVAGTVWKQMSGVSASFAPRVVVHDKSGAETGRADVGMAPADEVRGVLKQAIDGGEEVTWAIWAPAANRFAGADGKFSFKGPIPEGRVEVAVEGPAGSYRQSGDSLVAGAPGVWTIVANVPGVGANGFGADSAMRLKLGEAAVAMVQVPASRQWLVVVQEPWRAPAGSNQQSTAETFPNPEPWIRNGPDLTEQWLREAHQAMGGSRTTQRRPEDVIVQAIDDESELRVPFVRDMQRNPLICFAGRGGHPVQIMFGRRNGACVPVQRPELEMALVIVDPRVVFGYRENGTPVTLDDQPGFHMLAYVPRKELQFEREFGAGEYERLGRCVAKEGETIRLGEDALVRVRKIGSVSARTDLVPPAVEERYSVAMEGNPTGEGEYVVVGVDEQDRPHFPMRYAPIRSSPADGGDASPRLRDGVYAIRGELKAVEVWHRAWKRVTVKGYATEREVERK